MVSIVVVVSFVLVIIFPNPYIAMTQRLSRYRCMFLLPDFTAAKADKHRGRVRPRIILAGIIIIIGTVLFWYQISNTMNTSMTTQHNEPQIIDPELFVKLENIAIEKIQSDGPKGQNMQITSIDSLTDGIIVMSASKEYIESGGDQKYMIPGHSPLFIGLDGSTRYLPGPYGREHAIAQSLARLEVLKNKPDYFIKYAPIDVGFEQGSAPDIVTVVFDPTEITDNSIRVVINTTTRTTISYEGHTE